MKTHSKVLALVVLLAMILTLLSACGSKTETQTAAANEPEAAVETTESAAPAEDAADEPLEGEFAAEETGTFQRKTEPGTLTVATTGSVNGFDPAGVSNGYGCDLVYEQLLRVDPNTKEYVCELAESYELTDPTTAVFHLKDAYFSNGEPVTAEDCLYSLEAMLASRVASNYLFIDFENSFAQDDKTVVFKFLHEYGPWRAAFLAKIQCASAAAGMTEDDYWDKPVGSGPYTVVENVSGSHTTYALRDDYWDKDNMPEAKTITVRAYADTSTMFIDFENGVLDIVTNIGVTDVERLVAGDVPDCSYVIKSLPDNILLAMNSANEYLQNPDVRAAICYGIDFPAVGEAAKGVMFREATSSLPSDLPYYANVGQYEYNPDLAMEHLANSGYEPGQIELTMIIDANNVNNAISEAVQAYLAEIGITVNIESYDLMTAIGFYREGAADLSCKQLPAGVTTYDPEGFYSTMEANTTNKSVLINDDELQALFNDSVNTSDEDGRAEAYAAIQQWLVDNYWDPAVCESCACYAYRNYITYVEGVTPQQVTLRYVTFAD